MPPSPTVVVREVWGANLEDELKLIHQCLPQFRLASFDTEFPGTIFTTQIPFSQLCPSKLYRLMKQNVDSLKLIQLGLTLSDAHGNLPMFGTKFQHVWQFNFRDFDPARDRHNPESIALLRNQGIDFANNRVMGIDSSKFASKFNEYVMGRGSSGLTWITFHGLYDYGYLIKILTGRKLPNSYKKFAMLKQSYFGSGFCDAKDMAQGFGLYGGLEKISTRLNVGRAVGKSHQAGSDSLVTMQVFLALTMFIPAPILGPVWYV